MHKIQTNKPTLEVTIAKSYKVVTPAGITISMFNKELNVFEPWHIPVNETFNSADVNLNELSYFIAHSKIPGCKTVEAVDKADLDLNDKTIQEKSKIAKKGTEVPVK